MSGDMYVVVTAFSGGVDVITTHDASVTDAIALLPTDLQDAANAAAARLGRKLEDGEQEHSAFCDYFYANYENLKLGFSHWVEDRLASDCDVEKGVTAIACDETHLTFTVLSGNCADGVEAVNDDLKSTDEDSAAHAWISSSDLEQSVLDTFDNFLTLFPIQTMEAEKVKSKKMSPGGPRRNLARRF